MPLILKHAQWDKAHYVAFVVSSSSDDEVKMIDLGEAETIDQLIGDFRDCLLPDVDLIDFDPELPSTHSLGIRLRKAVFDPLTDELADRRRLMLAPDGNLTLLPFEVLPTGDARWLTDEFWISYLTTARDILRFGITHAHEPSAPLVAADPDFEPVVCKGLLAPDGSEPPVGRLPGTRIEGEIIAEILGVKPLLGGEVLEAKLKACRSPIILHLSTHGFFLPDQPYDAQEPWHWPRAIGWDKKGHIFWKSGSGLEDPLLRSFLALVGAKTWLRGGWLPTKAEDGLLTALDVSGLNLLATELATLAGCVTALGDVLSGEGVFGLQRAFVLAGAKTLVMSLWNVDDLATPILMERFYGNLLRGRARDESLRDAQRYTREVTIGEIRDPWLSKEMIERLSPGDSVEAKEYKKYLQGLAQEEDDYKVFEHPYFWAAFICQGDPRPLPQQPLRDSWRQMPYNDVKA